MDSGDVVAIGDKLAGLQQSLQRLQTVPDYERRAAQLEALKNQLEALLSPRAMKAFNEHATQVSHWHL